MGPTTRPPLSRLGIFSVDAAPSPSAGRGEAPRFLGAARAHGGGRQVAKAPHLRVGCRGGSRPRSPAPRTPGAGASFWSQSGAQITVADAPRPEHHRVASIRSRGARCSGCFLPAFLLKEARLPPPTFRCRASGAELPASRTELPPWRDGARDCAQDAMRVERGGLLRLAGLPDQWAFTCRGRRRRRSAREGAQAYTASAWCVTEIGDETVTVVRGRARG